MQVEGSLTIMISKYLIEIAGYPMGIGQSWILPYNNQRKFESIIEWK